MSLNTQVSSSFSDHIHSVLKKQFLDILRSELVVNHSGVKETLPQHMGNVIKWNRWTDFGANTTALTEGETPNGNTPTSTSVSVTLSQYGDYVTIADFLQQKAINDTVLDMVGLMGRSGAESIERLAVNELQANGTQNYSQKDNANASKSDVTSNTSEIRSDELRTMVQKLRVGKVRPMSDGFYHGFINPLMEMDLLAETAGNSFIILASNTTKDPVERATIGTACGIKLKRTTEVIADTSETDVYGNIFVGDKAFASVDMASAGLEIIKKDFGSGGTQDPLNQRSTIGYKFVYAAKVLEAVRAQILWAYNAG